MRYVIYGAGAIGATIGGRLHDAGTDVVLIARGDHLETLRREGSDSSWFNLGNALDATLGPDAFACRRR